MKQTYTHTEQDIALISETLIKARLSCSGLSQYPGELPQTLDIAYRIQDLSMSKWHDKLVGWKVGGIPQHLQLQLQGERLSGPIYASNVKHHNGNNTEVMPVFEDGYAAIEAEFIIELGDTAKLPSTGITEQQAIEAINKVYIGAEIASSPIQKINDLGPTAPISDFGNNSGLIIGREIENWQQLDISTVAVTVNIDGTIHGPSKTQSGLKGPVGATKFLIEQLKQRGHKINPGTFLSSGAITGVHDSHVGANATISFDGFGDINLTLVSNRN
ncbi:MAG: hypothetical protein KTR16_09095 [Acidiferrobacterales bacterium]|nr:hypothetical protein [Acidiferrobacterales bacterium]